MKVEVSRRKFLQGAVALTVIGGTTATSLFSNEHGKQEKPGAISNKNTKTGSTIVFHDSIKAKENLKYALPKTIEYLLEQGFVFDVIR